MEAVKDGEDAFRTIYQSTTQKKDPKMERGVLCVWSSKGV